jgi:diaminohydroxyphosphoribosylaminopyrimidine deaminase / 5-amino-6-(5-phosphoribosylamino)uracil reductase
MDESDARWMEHALRLGRRALGATSANPAVGCVIVAGGRLVGAGWTGMGGRPHAETGALAMASDAAHGATAYVTLEPCSHHGRTAPCAESLIKAGLARVVTGLEDPDPRVAGRGHAALEAAGIAVETGVLAGQARRDLAGYLSRNINKRPYVVLKLAVSSDGKIAETPGLPTAITGEAARNWVHAVRAEVDAVLVGVSTVLADDPELTCRLPGLAARSPVRVVSDSRASMPPDSRLARSAGIVPVWLLTLAGEDEPQARVLAGLGVVLIACAPTGDGKVDLADALHRLAERGINRVLAEGGARMARALIEADLVDEVYLISASKELGTAGLDALAGLPLNTITDSDGFRLAGKEGLGEDLLSVYERAHDKSTARPRESGDPEM